MIAPPILYSFRRCPYAMRARMALWVAGITVELREVKLAAKPPELLASSPKATVPVLVPVPVSGGGPEAGGVIDQSLDIMRWALGRNDPEGWLAGDDTALIAANDGPFKHHLDRAKYPDRYEADGVDHRAAALTLLLPLEVRLAENRNLCGAARSLTDAALFPFVRQFAAIAPDWFAQLPLPRLQSWLAAHNASELFAAIMLKFAPWTAGDAPILFGPCR